MKKILTITAFAFAGQFALAQNGENELKNFRFGLQVSPSINWYKPDGKIMAGNGVGVKFGGGVILEFRLAKVASFQTGIQINTEGGKIKYNNGGVDAPNANTVSYYYSNTDDVIDKFNSAPTDSLGAAVYNQSHTHYQLNERKFKATYITIPLMLKLKTKEIGTMTYFGQFGINSSFRWKATADDQLTVLKPSANPGGTDSKSKIDITKDMALFKASLAFGAGFEMNLSGSTSLLVGLNYNLGFTNVVKGDSGYLEKKTNGANIVTNATDYSQVKMPQVIKSNAVVLTVGILF
jgi:Outer membrane protein beta-barrel domain